MEHADARYPLTSRICPILQAAHHVRFVCGGQFHGLMDMPDNWFGCGLY